MAHDHEHAGHHHGFGLGHHHHDYRQLAADPRNRRALTIALAVSTVFLVVEVVGGFAFNSLALLSDAAHMLTDVAAYALALLAAWVATRPPTVQRSYGFARAEILAALVNGATLLAACGWIVFEATRRLAEPADVHGLGVVAVAVAGLGANLVAMLALARADRDNVNVRAALLHTATDALSSVGVIVAGTIVALTGFDRADAIASYLIAVLVIVGSLRLVREAVDVLLDAVPSRVDLREVAEAMLGVDGVTEVHDLHVWTLGPGMAALSAHVRIEDERLHEPTLALLQALLRERFSIAHSTMQLTADRSSAPIATVERLPASEAIAWATEHIAASHPTMSKSVIMAATGAAAVEQSATGHDRISPVAISVRALAMLRTRAAESPDAPDDLPH